MLCVEVGLADQFPTPVAVEGVDPVFVDRQDIGGVVHHMMPAARNEQTLSGTLDDVDSAPQETHRIAYLVDLDGEVRCEREIGIVLLVDSLDAIQSEVWCQLAASHIVEQEGELRRQQSPSVERAYHA